MIMAVIAVADADLLKRLDHRQTKIIIGKYFNPAR
jgi:hypothetical protein